MTSRQPPAAEGFQGGKRDCAGFDGRQRAARAECTAFPAWRGNLFLAALRPPGLVRLTMEGDRVVAEERLLWGRTRFRQVLTGPDGLLYILTDEDRGRVLRLEPAN